MVHREGAKSTVMTKFTPLYVASIGGLPNFGRVVNLVIFSATYAQAVDLLKDLYAAWESSDVLQETLFIAKNKKGRVIAEKENHLCFDNEKGQRIHIQALGAGDSMRGTKKNDENGRSHRIELFIFDDILKELILDSSKERQKLKKWFYGPVHQARNSKHYKKIVVGTPMTEDDILMEMLRSETYKSVLFPVADKFPVPLEDIVSSWPELHTPEAIMADYNEAKEMGALDEFFREKMLQVVNEEMRVFKDEWIHKFHYEDIKMDFPKMNFFTSLDLAVSAKKHGDHSAIITVGVTKEGHRFVVACKNGMMTPGEVIDELFRQVRKFNPIETRAEKAALQQVLDYFIQEKSMKDKVYFLYDALEKNSVDSKEFRIKSMQPLFKAGKMHFPVDVDIDGINELLYQLQGYIKTGPTTKHIDCVDTLANFMDPNFIIEPMGFTGSEIKGDEYDYRELSENIDNYDF
jgi:phage terminase large subunit-like protein